MNGFQLLDSQSSTHFLKQGMNINFSVSKQINIIKGEWVPIFISLKYMMNINLGVMNIVAMNIKQGTGKGI